MTNAGLINGTDYEVVSGQVAQNVSATTCYTVATEPHFDSSTTPNPSQYPTAMKSFVLSGGNFLAECEGIISYENLNGANKYQPHISHTEHNRYNSLIGWLLTTGGVYMDNLDLSDVTVLEPDLAFLQFDGALEGNMGQSVLQDWTLSSTSSWINNGRGNYL